VRTLKGDTVGKIAVHEFISLDGVFEDPSWTAKYPFDPKMGEAIARLMGPDASILLGRRTYEMFYPAWSKRTADDDPGAPFFNEARKYVVSGTLKDAAWNNSEIVGPYSVETISTLKKRTEGNLYVSGSGTLVRAMLADGLVDELHLFVFPVALGKGARLFADKQEVSLSPLEVERYDSGVIHLAYGPEK
jgi:dihydrofolate reductase